MNGSPMQPDVAARDGADRVVCYCMNVTEGDVRAHFATPGATYESLVRETGIVTKCTACRLDLDLLLNRLHQKGPAEAPAAAGAAVRSRALMRPQDLSDAGFLYNKDGIATVLRIDNRGLLFEDRARVVGYRYALRCFTPEGRIAYRTRGRIAVDDGLEVDFARLPGCPETGWFLVSLYPAGPGLVGTTRPQLVVKGPDWVSSVHTQWLSMSCRFKAALIRSRRGRTNSLVSVINAVPKRTEVTLELRDGADGYAASRSVPLAPMGSALVDLDALFPTMPEDRNLHLGVRSDRPVSKHLILRHPDGSWSQNHFANVR